MKKTLGKPEDDVTNRLTARLLLLLESRPLVEPEVHKEIVEEVIASYWRDYEDHKSNFVPAFLANDILRLWRTFCVNYEANTEREPDDKKAKGKLKNYKLKHSRLLTCYSAILYFLAIYGQQNTVTPGNAMAMTRLTPTERLEWLLEQEHLNHAHGAIAELLSQYEGFLSETNNSEERLVSKFKDKKTSQTYTKQAHQFGDTLFEVLTAIGEGSRLHKLLVV